MAEFTGTTLQAELEDGDQVIGFRGSTDSRWLKQSLLLNFDTDDLAEGATNLFFTNERVDDRVDALIQDSANGSITWAYNDGSGTLTPTIVLTPFGTQNLAESANSNHYVQPAGVSISDAQIKNLFTTPVAIASMSVPASRAYMLFVSIAKAHIDTTGYTNSGIDLVDTATNNILFTFPSSLIATAGDRVMQAAPVTTAVVITEANNVSVRARTSDPTGGNAANTLKVFLEYRILDFSTVV